MRKVGVRMGTKRLHLIDAIRGLSLFGILAANMLIFQYGFYGKDEMELFEVSRGETYFHTFLQITVEGSFMPIFAFLFGFGMVKMVENLQELNLGVKRTAARRFVFLIVLGLLHSVFLWEGDILLGYGITGLFLLFFLKRKAKTLLIWAVILFGATVLLGYGGSVDDYAQDDSSLSQYVTKTNMVYGEGSYLDILQHRMNEDPMLDLGVPEGLVPIVALFALFIGIFPFLFGMYGAKRGWFTSPEQEKKLYTKGLVLLPFGLMCKSAYFLMGSHPLSGVLFIAGSMFLAAGYLFLFAYFYTAVRNPSFFGFFGYVGRLSLTNYISQTIICTTIFYGYGLGLFGELGIVYGFLLTIVVYYGQVHFSKWYLKHFRTGPLERAARIATYLTLSGRPKKKSALEGKKAAS